MMIKQNKYGAIKTEVDNILFASKKEAARYKQLKLQERTKIITNLVLQPSFLLQEKFDKNFKHYRAINYIADFMYYDAIKKKDVVEDVKSVATKTQVYMLKKKLFELKYKDLEITEIL